MLTLQAQKRDKEKSGALRKKGMMPAVLYGKKTPATSIILSQKEFVSAWQEAGESSVISVKTPNAEFEALIHAVDLDPVTDYPRHADFYVFEKGHKISVKVPIEFIGVSPAVKELGGVLVKVLHELRVEAMPKDLPQKLEVDISSLATFGSQILTRDIKLPLGVTVDETSEEVIALVAEPKEEEVVEETPIDLTQIEVEKKGKEKTPEEEAAEATAAASVEKAPKGDKKKA